MEKVHPRSNCNVPSVRPTESRFRGAQAFIKKTWWALARA